MSLLYERVPCNLCGGTSYKVFYEGKIKDDPLISLDALKKDYSASSNIILTDRIVKCDFCGLVFVNPRLKLNSIIECYSQAIDELYVSQAESRIRTFRKAISLVEKYSKQKGRILDVGAAAGFFLKAAKENKWETYGVEPSKWMSEYGNRTLGVNIKQGTLEEAEFPDNYFDVVTMWDVLEHTGDPMATLKEANRVLKKDGLLVVNFPNIGDPLARLFGRRWWFILAVHLYYFTPHTLSEMLKKSGFKVKAIRPHFQRLTFGYLVYRLKPYSKMLYTFLNGFTKLFKIGDCQVIYYASQTNIIAVKLKDNI